MSDKDRSVNLPANEVVSNSIVARFDGEVHSDTREGYEGYIVNANMLPEVASVLKDELGYDYLSSVTGVDYIDEDHIEVVYHADQTTGGKGINIKVQLDRDNPVVPTLVPIYPGADFQ